MIEAAKRLLDPVFFSQAILNFRPFKYQEDVLRDSSKRIIICAGRQVGKSTIIAIKALHFALCNPRTTTLIVSATLRQSMIMFDKIVDLIENNKILANSVKYRSRTRIRFSNGSWIIALPCGRTGSTLRGYTAHLIIFDEAAFMPEEVITNVALPMVATTNGSVWMLSTPWETDHIFYKIWASGESWSKYHFPSSINPLITKQFLDEQRYLIGEERFRIEYEAEFIEEGNSYFPMKLLRNCIGDVDGVSGSHFAGYDPGGKASKAALVIVCKSNKYYVVDWIFKHSDNYTTMNVEVAEKCRKYGVSALRVDQTGIGQPIIEHLRELNLPAEGVVLTEKAKEEILSNLRLLVERGEIVFPNSPELLNSLNCVTYERTRSGGYKFGKRSGTYDDLAYALALAVRAPDVGIAIIKK